MTDVLKGLAEVIRARKLEPEEGSYTCYLFEQGTDKILKKCGEECSEVIIAAKNGDKAELANEICDLAYHLLVLLEQQEVPLSDIESILEARRQKIGNLKTFHQGNKES